MLGIIVERIWRKIDFGIMVALYQKNRCRKILIKKVDLRKFTIQKRDLHLKQNKFCPGSKIPIKSIDFLKEIKDNIGILPLAWNFYKEIRNRVKKVRPKQNDFFILCFPKLKSLNNLNSKT